MVQRGRNDAPVRERSGSNILLAAACVLGTVVTWRIDEFLGMSDSTSGGIDGDVYVIASFAAGSMMSRGLAILALLVGSTAAHTVAQTPSTPQAVLEQFLKLDTEGGQLTTEGWKQVAGLFTAPTKPSLGTVVLVRDCGVSPTTIVGAKPGAYIECIQLGELDVSNWRFSKLEIKQRSNFDLVSNSSGWRIAGSPPEPHVTVATAIRFVHERQNQTADPVVRKKADALLRSFRTLQ